jgi:hypothetical protein
VHDDKQASLTVGTGDDGRVLLHCHAGCSTSDVVAALGLREADLFPPRNGTPRPAAAKPGKATWKPIQPVPRSAPDAPAVHYRLREASRRWAYRDGDGELLGFICRFDTPSGKEIRPLIYAAADDGRMAWRWQGFPRPRPLYNLPALPWPPGRTRWWS